MGGKWRWGIVLDAGSSGTRLYIYKWKDAAQAIRDATPEGLQSLPTLKLVKSQKIRPGVSSFAARPTDIGPDHLQSLIDIAVHEIPHHSIRDTPVFLMATAGMRLLGQNQQRTLLKEICSYMQQNTNFQFPDCTAHVQVISGETEGLYGWVAANYLLGGFDYDHIHAHGKGHHTYGFLDMGGASTQVAFAPNATETTRHADDLKLVRMRNLNGTPQEYKVFTASFLGFGANTARQRYVEMLQDQYASFGHELPDPCMPRGLRTTMDGNVVTMDEPQNSTVLLGTGKFFECVRHTYLLLAKDAVCEDPPCLLHGLHVPAIDFDVNHFVGVSEYWHTTHGVFGNGSRAYDLVSYQEVVSNFCSQDWALIESKVGSKIEVRKKDLARKIKDAQEACFKASWLINVLYDGIGIPRVGLNNPPISIQNTSSRGMATSDGRFEDAFKPVNKINGVEVSWALGKILLYAAGQIPPSDGNENLPVGFGTNKPGVDIPADFEYAGSSYLPAGVNGSGGWADTADELLWEAQSKVTASLLGLLAVVLVIAALLIRKRDYRLRLLRKFDLTRRRRRKPGRGLSFANKLFGRNPGGYERVLEEGAGDRFDLDELDSDSSEEGCRSAVSSGLLTPSINHDRLDEGWPGTTIDRKGLAARTENRGRLVPTLQMLNAGRRSRAASPTRMRSPLLEPLRGG